MKKYDILERISDKTSKLNRVDFIIISIIIILYGIISFYHLGDFKVPQTYKTFKSVNDNIIISLKSLPNKLKSLTKAVFIKVQCSLKSLNGT